MTTLAPDRLEPADALPLEELVSAAAARLGRQAAYAALSAKGGARAAALDAGLRQARACVLALARPRIAQLPLTASAGADGVVVGGRVTIADPALHDDLASGGALCATLCSLGYGQEDAFAWVGRDYVLHHLQTELARETLFALARTADRAARLCHPGWRLCRIPVRTQAACGPRHLWEPAQVQALLSLFSAAAAGVTLTETGFFQPLHSLLTLTVLRPPGGTGLRAACPDRTTAAQTGGG